MSNALYEVLNDNPINNMTEMIKRLRDFQSAFRGDPKQEVMRLVQSGRVSQAQLNQAQNMANQIRQIMK